MSRTTEARKSEHLGIPLERETKRRLKRVAAAKGRPHTEIAREYVVNGIEKDEQQLVGAK